MLDEETKKAFEELRQELGKNVDAVARVDALEESAQKRDADLTGIRKELDEIKEHTEKREKEIAELQKKGRQQLLAASPELEKRQAVRMFGIQMRQTLCRALNQEAPVRFKEEADELRQYEQARADRGDALVRATLEAGAATGSYLVPTMTSVDLIDAVEELSELPQLVDYIPDLPGNVDIPVLTTRPTMQSARSTVDTTMTQSDPAFSRVQIRPDEAYVYFPLDNRLMQMSALGLGNIALRLCREAIGEGIANWVLNADGTSSYNSLTGIMNEATYVISMSAGKTSFADVDNAELNAALQYLLKRGRGPKCKWLMSLFVLGVLEDLNREGKVKVIKEMDNGDPLCKRRPIVIDEGMPEEGDDAVNTAFLGCGDLASYIVGLVGGVRIDTSEHYKFGENQTAFRAVVNMDIKRKPVKTFVTVKTAAS